MCDFQCLTVFGFGWKTETESRQPKPIQNVFATETETDSKFFATETETES